MTAAPAIIPVDWHAPIRTDHSEVSNMAAEGGLPYSRIWAWLASAAAHGAVVALLLNNAAEPLPTGQAIVVELVVETARKSTDGDGVKRPAPPDAPTANHDFGETIRRIKMDTVNGPLAPTVTSTERPAIESIARLPAEPIPVPAAPEAMSDDLPGPQPKPLEQRIDSRKYDRPKDWTANVPLPRPRPKPARQSNDRLATFALSNVMRAQRPVPEDVRWADVKLEGGGEIREIRPEIPAKASPKGAGAPRRGGANSVGRQGSAKQLGGEPEGISDAAQLPGNPRPRYPTRAVDRGWQGRVILDVEVLPSGKAGTVRIAMSSGYGVLDRSARDTVRKWRFKAARRAGIPHRSKVRVPVQFKLEK